MSRAGVPSKGVSAAVAYEFQRATCLRYTLFSAALVVMFIILVVLAPNQRLIYGFVPGWLVGAFGAVLFSIVGVSWARRWSHKGPALLVSDAGITANRWLGGIFRPRFNQEMRWDEITTVSRGSNGSVILQLRDPQAFWARQPLIARVLCWHPLRSRRGRVALGGPDLDADSADVVRRIDAALSRALERTVITRLSPEEGREPGTA